MFEVTKNCNVFPCSLKVCKNWINLIWAVTMQKFMKYFYFSCNSFFGTFILVFPYHGDIVLLFRENCFLILSFSKSENTQNIPTIPTFHDLNSYFCPTFSKFWALLYPYFFTGGHLKACVCIFHFVRNFVEPIFRTIVYFSFIFSCYFLFCSRFGMTTPTSCYGGIINCLFKAHH